MMHSSARNAFYGRIDTIRHSGVFTEVCLTAQHGFALVAVIMSESFSHLGLCEGGAVTALIKAPEILVGKSDTCPTSRNCFPGRIMRIRNDGVAVEIMGELTDGTPMCALITAGSLEHLGLAQGDDVVFFFKGFNVILSAE